MFCTGGIRCEKSTAYLKQQGFSRSSISVAAFSNTWRRPESESLWRGECFVFDNRVTVNHDLEKGGYDQCHACRRPITEDDKRSPHYLKGVSCHHCHDQQSQRQRNVTRAGTPDGTGPPQGRAHIVKRWQARFQRRSEQNGEPKMPSGSRDRGTPSDLTSIKPAPATSGH